jgi:transcription elongation factor Elf1
MFSKPPICPYCEKHFEIGFATQSVDKKHDHRVFFCKECGKAIAILPATPDVYDPDEVMEIISR